MNIECLELCLICSKFSINIIYDDDKTDTLIDTLDINSYNLLKLQ